MKTRKYTRLIMMIGIIAFVLVSFYKCPYDYIFGISCPGCGMTRAFLSLLRFDFAGSFYYHPLWPVVVAVVLYMILEYFKIFSLSEETKKVIMGILCVIFIAVYFLRLFSDSTVVIFNFEDSLLHKIIEFIKHFILPKITS